MGVPKFYRWLSERYPLINQRHGVRATDDVARQHFDRPPPDYIPAPDPLSTCGLPPIIDRLYIDMNGIIHGCSHNNNAGLSSSSSSSSSADSSSSMEDADMPDENAVNHISEAEIFRNIGYYLDRIVKEIARPRELVYLAIDGVAPRAKLNQQRARRYRSAKEGEIERTVYDAHRLALEQQQQQDEANILADYDLSVDSPTSLSTSSRTDASISLEGTSVAGSGSGLREVEPGRFTGKFETHTTPAETTKGTDRDFNANDSESSEEEHPEDVFHSNYITPGTPFFQRCTAFLEQYIRDKIANDPEWAHLQIIFSGPNTPGEGEHKIMQFLREQRARADYDPNRRHCIMGQDGDLIMLGLATHEPNLVLLREQVLFDRKRQRIEKLAQEHGLDLYLFNANFEFLHMNILRDYLALELETSNVVPTSPFDLERTVDDFVFLTFFVGNDFLPHMPALDIADEALDLLIFTYRMARQKWQQEYEQQQQDESNDNHHHKSVPPPYLTHAGEIVCGKRLEHFLQYVGRHESNYYAYKEQTTDYDEVRRVEARFGRNMTPSDQILQAKEDADRSKYRELVEEAVKQKQMVTTSSGFRPVMASRLATPSSSSSSSSSSSEYELNQAQDEAEQLDRMKRMGNLLHYSVADQTNKLDDYDPQKGGLLVIDDTDFKGRYYADKFGFSPYDASNHLALRKAYVEGLVWNLRYYYQSHENLSWEWFYPYHYGPMISDLVALDSVLKEISFEDRTGAPLKPFEQLLACLPASQAKLLPEPYQELMIDDDSPIRDFYPDTFTVDMNGKRWPWEAVVLLPFIDSQKLRDSAASIDTTDLSPEDLARNDFYDAIVIRKGENGSAASVPLPDSEWGLSSPRVDSPCFRPSLHEKTKVPLDGLPTLRDGSIRSMARKRIYVNVHGSPSRYQTALLEVANEIPEFVPLDSLASLIGQTIYINYPSLIESFVTAVSNSKIYIRGKNPPKPWDSRESTVRSERVKHIVRAYWRGLGLTGTGGLTMPIDQNRIDTETLLNVRPFTGLKTLPDGTVVRTYAKFEVEVPLFVLSWAPVEEDHRLRGVPLQLEKDPYNAAKRVITDRRNPQGSIPSIPLPSNKPFIRDMFPGDSPSELGGAARALVKSRGISSLARPFGTSRRGFSSLTTISTSNATSVLNRNQTFTQASRKLPSLNHSKGRLFVAGLVVIASLLGIKPAQATQFSKMPDAFSNPWVAASQVQNGLHSVHDNYGGPVASRQTPPLDFLHGTTTLSFKYQGGIVAAVDSRASLGNYVGSKTTQKVLPINKSILGTMAGGAADCMFWIRRLAAEASLHEVCWDGRRMSVARASRLLANALYQNRNAGLSVGTMIMGFDSDDEDSPPRIFYVDNSGMRIEGDMFAVGSGSTYAQGILDTERRYDMTDEEAIALGLKAIRHATFRDAGSGGFINVYLIKRDGWIHVFRQDVASLQPLASDYDES